MKNSGAPAPDASCAIVSATSSTRADWRRVSPLPNSGNTGRIRNSLTIVVRKASSLPTITAGRTMIAFGKAAVRLPMLLEGAFTASVQSSGRDRFAEAIWHARAPNRTRVWAFLKRDGTLSLTERPVHLVGEWLHQIRDRGSALRRDEHLDRHAGHEPHVVGLRRGLFHELQLSDVMLLRR